MNHKERVLTTLNHKEPDRVPRTASFTPEFADKLKKHFKMDSQEYDFIGGSQYELELKLGDDFLMTTQGFANSYYQSLDEPYIDEWGIKWDIAEYNTANGPGRYTEAVGKPLKEDGDIDNYNPPDPKIESRYDSSKKLIEEYGKEYPIIGVVVCTIFETAWALRGLENLMIDLVQNEELANRILDIPYNYHLYAGKRLAELGVDLIWTGDDVGGQEGMIMSTEMWRKYFKPRLAIMWSEFKSINPDIKIIYHSDGNIDPIVDELVEIGMDVLNPVQPKCMDPYRLKKRYGKNLSYLGTIDIQETLPFGSPEEVEAETKERIKYMGPGGGFVLAPSHHVQVDTSLKNFFTFWESVVKYGKYPLDI
jgi:uroporphyrinogen decarboxylase